MTARASCCGRRDCVAGLADDDEDDAFKLRMLLLACAGDICSDDDDEAESVVCTLEGEGSERGSSRAAIVGERKNPTGEVLVRAWLGGLFSDGLLSDDEEEDNAEASRDELKLRAAAILLDCNPLL